MMKLHYNYICIYSVELQKYDKDSF